MTNLFLNNIPSRQALGLLRSVRACANRAGFGDKIYTDLVVPFTMDTPTKTLQVYIESALIDDLVRELRHNSFPATSTEDLHEDGSISVTLTDTWVLYEDLNGASLTISSIKNKLEQNKLDFTFKGLLWRMDHLMDSKPIHQNRVQFEVFLQTAAITDSSDRGIQDINKKLLKCSQNPEKVFQKYPIRMLEAVNWGTKGGFLVGDREYEAILACGPALCSLSGEEIARILLCDMASGHSEDPEAPYIWLEELKLAPIVKKILKQDQSAAKFMRKNTKLLPKEAKKRLRKYGFRNH